MLRSIWTAYNNVPKSLPASSGTNTRDFASFFIFWLCSLPAIWFPVHKIRHLFTVKAYFVPIAGVTFFIWSVVRAHGIGPIVHQPASKSGGALGWAMVQGIMSSIANFATLIGMSIRFDPSLSDDVENLAASSVMSLAKCWEHNPECYPIASNLSLKSCC